MALHVRQTITGGLARALSRNGALLVATFFVASVLQGAFVWVLATTYIPLGTSGAMTPANTPAPGTALPALASAGAALLGGLTGGILTLPIQVVAVRALVDDGRDHIPEQLVFRSLGWATLRLFVASLLKIAVIFVLTMLSMIAVFLAAIGVFLVLPESLQTTLVGSWYASLLLVPVFLLATLPIGVVVVVFAFVDHEIVVRDASVPSAFVRSWRVVAGNRLRLGLALVVPYGVNMAFSLLFGQLTPDATFQSPTFLASQAILSLESAVVSIVVLGITAQAWVQLTGVDGPLEAYWNASDTGSSPAPDGAATDAVE
ncbi:hypothetical protein [Halomicrobium mukohataei]|uniref:DUF7847 domain-containing protein n=2 Tax=Halomicrobium mukohataei TaxID=57705 RepID=C7P555_HALMD|nr:hypothetical protein [Halomicrobium mukohataei]ACV49450.1 hypothetical protein Hmuk_3364 [Halomicrobium mukohataei DSM 12286]QCD67273.1 hypothetical protein E5139_16680 [Halomicrobium mukohataei]